MPHDDESVARPMPFDEGPHAERLGPYRLLEIIGSGGMGEVWLAEQLEPIRRPVAIKLLILAMHTRELVARFEAERQMLALMHHPNIASVFDGGISPTGRPYFVMELVRGLPITEYCDAQRLPTRERLRLFGDVCRAVQHAHQKGVIHRDLKPSNVLVAVTEGGPVVKVIDFGIAKAVGGQWLTDKTLRTRAGQKLGTPAYMSPEQIEGSGIDIDTRSDVYSLGVMLYELLTGTLPSDEKSQTALEEFVREGEVERPSARLRTLVTRDTVAKLRQTTADDLRRQLSGDLDWIVLRAMERDRTRRYDTANSVAHEIERFLRQEPVLARPPSTTYRLQKFVRRHRAATAAGAVTLIGLTLGAGAAATGFMRARQSEAVARQEAAAAREVSSFLVNLFATNDPGEARGNIVTVRELLDRGAASVRANIRTDQHVRAGLLHTLGKVYLSLGMYQQAESLLRDALEIEQQPNGVELAVPTILRELASAVRRQGRRDEAASMLRPAISMRTREGRALPDTALTLLMVELAQVESASGRHATADTLLRSALRLQESSASPDSLVLAGALSALAFLNDDDPVTFEPMLRRAYAIERAILGSDHPRTLGAAHNLSLMLAGMGRLSEAERLLQEVVAERERVYGADHPTVFISVNELGRIQLEGKRPGEAAVTLERAMNVTSVRDSSLVGVALANLARARLQLGEVAMAESLFLRSVALLERTRGPAHNRTAQARTGLGELYLRTKRVAKAEAALRMAIRDQERNWGPTHRQMIAPLVALGALCGSALRFAEADSLYRWAIRASDAGLVADHPQRAEVRRLYAALLHATGKANVADSVERSIAALPQPQGELRK